MSSPKTPKIPKAPPEIQQVVTEEGEERRRRTRRSVSDTGRQQNILSGIQMALKQRLGE